MRIRWLKRLLSIAMTFVMVLGCIPVTALAQNTDTAVSPETVLEFSVPENADGYEGADGYYYYEPDDPDLRAGTHAPEVSGGNGDGPPGRLYHLSG